MSRGHGIVGENGLLIWLALSAAFIVAAVGAVAVRAAARRGLGVVDVPDPIIPAHTRPVATVGGIAVALGCLAGVAVIGLTETVSAELAIGALLFLAIGVMDDLLKLSVRGKLLPQLLAAGIVVALGAKLEVTGNGALDAALAFVWILVVVNAVNLTDICDGLVSGLAAIAFLTLAAIDPSRGEVAIIAAGACAGFLVLNAPRASIFLGDAGSHFIGFLLAALSMQTVGGRDRFAEFTAVLLVLGVFLFELVFLVWARRRRGLSWWLGSDDHAAIRLQAAGLTVWSTDVILWVCGAMLGIGAILMHRLDGLQLLPLGIAVAAFLVIAWRVLAGLMTPTEAEVVEARTPAR